MKKQRAVQEYAENQGLLGSVTLCYLSKWIFLKLFVQYLFLEARGKLIFLLQKIICKTHSLSNSLQLGQSRVDIVELFSVMFPIFFFLQFVCVLN